ncbi:putative glutamate receptor [Babylonia areolata]|uniref:putative glutamate receptor n=1 Tax=Babylonia areolata TaxID=304850 RepID=UPI003FD66349
MTRILIVHPSLQSSSSCSFANLTAPSMDGGGGDKELAQPGENSTVDLSECLEGGPEEILPLVRQFFHVAVLSKSGDCVRLQTMILTTNESRTLSNVGVSYRGDPMAMSSEVFPNTKWRLNGQRFIVATAIWEPFVMVKKAGGQEVYSGLCIDMLKALAHSLNFTYVLQQPPDGQYGSIENGSWTGLVRMLKDKKAQLVVAPIAVNELRATVVDFSTPFYQDYTGVLFKRPDPALHKWKTYFMPFSWKVLVLIGVSFVVGTAFGHMIVWAEPLVLQGKKMDIGLMDTVQYFFGALLAQGGEWKPTTASARIFVSAWWLFCVVMAAIYSGNLTASFAVSNYDPSFTTLEGMLDQQQYEFGTVPGTIWIDIFKFSNRSDFKRIKKKIWEFTSSQAKEEIDETGDHVLRTLREDYAYVGNTASLSLTLAEYCDLMILEETFLPLQYAIALQKRSPLTDTVSRWILQMNEGGLDDLWSRRWWPTPEQQCGVSKKTEVKVVRLDDCQSAFFILLLGIGAALAAVLAENVVHRYLRRGKCGAGRAREGTSAGGTGPRGAEDYRSWTENGGGK